MENKYRDHIKESYGRDYIENENGFVTYSVNDDYCVIHTLYVIPDKRKSRAGSELANMVIEKLNKKTCKKLLCEIDLRSKTRDSAYEAITRYGFKEVYYTPNFIILEKRI